MRGREGNKGEEGGRDVYDWESVRWGSDKGKIGGKLRGEGKDLKSDGEKRGDEAS